MMMPKRKPKKTKDHEQGKPAVNRNIKDRLFRFIFAILSTKNGRWSFTTHWKTPPMPIRMTSKSLLWILRSTLG